MDPSQSVVASAIKPVVAQLSATVANPPVVVVQHPVVDAAVKASTPDFWAEPAFWSALPNIFWVVAISAAIIYFHEEIGCLFRALAMRIRDGSQLKIGGIEIAQSSGLVVHQGRFSKDEDSRIGVYHDEGERAKHRNALYDEARGTMLVHRIQRSPKEGQLYDIIIYIVPHKDSGLNGVVKVEYFLGHFWSDRVFPSSDRARGFPLVTSAYGPFMCTAKVKFNDGYEAVISRYIDFEMGQVAPKGSITG